MTGFDTIPNAAILYFGLFVALILAGLTALIGLVVYAIYTAPMG